MLLLLVMVLVVLLLCPLANHFKVKSVTHGAPVVDSNPFDPSGRKRFRHYGDPVAFFGFSCTVFATLLAESPRLLVMAPRVLAKQPFFTEDIYELPVSTSSSCSTRRASGWGLGWNKTRKLVYTRTVAVRSVVATQIGLVPFPRLEQGSLAEFGQWVLQGMPVFLGQAWHVVPTRQVATDRPHWRVDSL